MAPLSCAWYSREKLCIYAPVPKACSNQGSFQTHNSSCALIYEVRQDLERVCRKTSSLISTSRTLRYTRVALCPVRSYSSAEKADYTAVVLSVFERVNSGLRADSDYPARCLAATTSPTLADDRHHGGCVQRSSEGTRSCRVAEGLLHQVQVLDGTAAAFSSSPVLYLLEKDTGERGGGSASASRLLWIREDREWAVKACGAVRFI